MSNKKSKRLEFTEEEIKKIDKKAKKHRLPFKTYAEKVLIEDANKK